MLLKLSVSIASSFNLNCNNKSQIKRVNCMNQICIQFSIKSWKKIIQNKPKSTIIIVCYDYEEQNIPFQICAQNQLFTAIYVYINICCSMNVMKTRSFASFFMLMNQNQWKERKKNRIFLRLSRAEILSLHIMHFLSHSTVPMCDILSCLCFISLQLTSPFSPPEWKKIERSTRA